MSSSTPTETTGESQSPRERLRPKSTANLSIDDERVRIEQFAREQLNQIREAKMAFAAEKQAAERSLDQKRNELERQTQLLITRLQELHERERLLNEKVEDSMSPDDLQAALKDENSGDLALGMEAEAVRRRLQELEDQLELVSAERDAAQNEVHQLHNQHHEQADLVQEREDLKKRVGELEEQHATITAQSTARSEENERLRKKVTEVEQQLHKSLTESKVRAAVMTSADYQQIMDQLKKMTSEQVAREQELKTAYDQIEELQGRIEELQNELEPLRAEFETTREQIEHERHQLAELEQLRTERNVALDQLEKMMRTAAPAAPSAGNDDLDELRDQYKAQALELEQLQAEHEVTLSQLEEVREQYLEFRELKAERDSLQAQLQKYMDEHEAVDLASAPAKQGESLFAFEDVIEEKNRELAEFQSRISELEAANAELEAAREDRDASLAQLRADVESGRADSVDLTGLLNRTLDQHNADIDKLRQQIVEQQHELEGLRQAAGRGMGDSGERDLRMKRLRELGLEPSDIDAEASQSLHDMDFKKTLQELEVARHELEAIKRERDVAVSRLRRIEEANDEVELAGVSPSRSEPTGDDSALRERVTALQAELEKTSKDRDDAWNYLQDMQEQQRKQLDQVRSERDAALMQLRQLTAEPEHWAQQEEEFAEMRRQLREEKRQLAEEFKELQKRRNSGEGDVGEKSRRLDDERGRLDKMAAEITELSQQLKTDRDKLDIQMREMRLRDAQLHLREAEFREIKEIAELEIARDRSQLKEDRLQLARMRESLRQERERLRQMQKPSDPV